MMDKTMIFHILEIKTKRILVSSLDEEKLEKLWLNEYCNGKEQTTDFIWSYDGEPIRKEQPDGLTVGTKFYPMEELAKMSPEDISKLMS